MKFREAKWMIVITFVYACTWWLFSSFVLFRFLISFVVLLLFLVLVLVSLSLVLFSSFLSHLMYSYSTWMSLPSLYICAFFQISRLICLPPPPGGKNSLEEGDTVAVFYIQWGSGWENLILTLDIFRVHLFALSVMLVN